MDYSATAGGKEKRNKNFITSSLTAQSKDLILGLPHPKVSAPTKRQSTKNGFSYSHKVQETDTWEETDKKVLKSGSPSPKGNQLPVAVLERTRHSHLGHHHVFFKP